MGMFGNSQPFPPQAPVAASQNGWLPQLSPQLQQLAAAPPVAPPHPSFFAPGGAGRAIAGNIGDALLTMSGHSPIYAPLMAKQQSEQSQQMAELQRQMALAQFKNANPEPTAIQRNHDYFTSLGRPDLADSYLNAEANPQTLMTDPVTGTVGFYPKGGAGPSSSPDIPSVTDDAAGHAAYAALPKGAKFRTPDGLVRTKS